MSFAQDTKRLKRKLAKLTARTPFVVEKALMEQANRILSESQKLVPVSEGTLKASGKVKRKRVGRDTVEITVEYEAPYAVSVHENPRSGKTGGISPSGKTTKNFARTGQWKYLSIPFNKNRRSTLKALTRAVKKLAKSVAR